jgi:hypothetical protein
VRAALLVVLIACSSSGMGDDVDGGPDASGDDIAVVPPGCLTERSLADRPDDHGFDQIRVLYVTPADGPDNARDTNGQICNSVRAWATWFNRRSDAFLRLDTSGGLIDIGFVRLAANDVQMRGNDPGNNTIETGIAFVRERIERALEAQGLVAPNKAYAVYYEGSSSWACGGGAWPPLISDRVGAMYLKGVPFGTSIDCGAMPWGRADLVPEYIDYAMLHEIVHTLGFVPDASPHEHSYGHIFEVGVPTTHRDLMYSPRPQMPDPPWGIYDGDGALLDVNGDDYYGTSGYDLARSSILAPLAQNAQRPIGW